MSYTNLKYLRGITGNNHPVICELIHIFLNQVPEFIQNMKNLYASGDYLLLGKEAHKAKSSLLIVGMNDLSAAMKAFQLKTLEGSDTDSYPGYIQMFEEQCLAAVEELKQVLAELEPGSASE